MKKMQWLYKQTETNPGLWTVGYYDPDGKWLLVTDATASDYALFWKPNGCGYTYDFDKAGRYTKEEYERLVVGDNARDRHVLVPVEEVEHFAVRVIPAIEIPLP